MQSFLRLFGRPTRFFLLLSLFITMTASAVAADNPKPTSQNTLSISGPFEFTSLDPSKNGYIYTRMQVLETLLGVDNQGHMIPELATKWQVSDNGLSWRFKLRKGVVFHDGQPLDANAVVKSLLIAMAKHGTLAKAPISNIHALSEGEVEIQLTRPYTLLGAVLANYANSILSPDSYGRKGNVLAMSGTGPYELFQYAPPHKLVVKQFAGYWGKKASIPFASYLTGHRAESRVLQARSGQADIVFGVDPASIPMLQRLPNVSVFDDALPRTIVLKLNSGYPYLNDVRARQALSLAINRRGIANAVLRSPGSQTEQLLPASFADWHLPNIKSPEQPLVKAQALLASLGWHLNQDGVLERNGKPFELTLITYADRPELITVATALQAQWAKIGVKLKVNMSNSSAIPAGHQDGSLQVALMARNYGFVPDPLGVMLSDYGRTGGDWGAMNWNDESVDRDLAALQSVTDKKVRHQLAQHVAQVIYQDRPVIPVTFYKQHTAVNSRVKGFHFDPFERTFYLNDMVFVAR